ncbi:MAG: ATP-dependent Clp protease ATP-binding subunit, partial [Anaerofustis stercorihominis]|nr:ATP-dependent Clp protease ATP-binding subunit [Anaerofustis stercorihominis]
GRITDGQGRTVDFKNTIIIMTSNIGASLIRKSSRPLGFINESEEKQAANEYESMKETVLTQLRNSFRPEFLNRIDETLVFHSLNKDDIDKIIDVLLKQFITRCEGINIKISYTDNLKKLIAAKGTNLEYGARPLKRTIQNLIEDSMSEEMLKGNIAEGDSVIIDADEEKVIFKQA